MRRLRARIALSAIGASALALVTVLLLLWPELRDRTVEQTRETLLAEAALLSRVVAEPLARGGDSPALDALVDETARDIRSRVRLTVIALDGRVLADSSVSGTDLLALENHLRRPEVEAALASGSGSIVRRSSTVEQELLYAAVAIRHQGQTVGVARVARTMDAVEEQAQGLRRAMAAALALALALALVLATLLSASWARALEQVIHAARRMAAGDLGARVTVSRDDEIGELSRLLNQAADEQKRRIEDVARGRAQTEAILSGMEEGVLALDPRGNVLMASPAFRGQFTDTTEPVGRHYLEVVRQREIADLLEVTLRTGVPQRAEVEVWPRQRVYAITAGSLPAEGDTRGAVATFHDITDRRRIDQIRRDFVANASHELRTPLTSIRGFVEALEDGAVKDPATSQRFLAKIRTHADRMTVLMDDLLELSRLESRDEPPRLERVNVAEVLDDVSTSFAPGAARKELRLSLRNPGGLVAVADRDRLRRVLECLVENAIKYTPTGGAVDLTARTDETGAVEIEVRDNGPGIPPEHLPRIFERFYRVDKARSRELGGTGLGLSIAKHLAEGMGASLHVTSEVGVGSCFSVRVPQSAGA
jgi:two-component system phosphate regulon sensor histidine kinase PhoR